VNGGEEGKSQELVISRRRGGDGDDKHHGGVWKIAYADFMTAMMAFFLVMWLINSTDKKTLTQVATYFNPMRLTDKRPTPKGLQEPDGSEGKEAATQTGGKKMEQGEGKGTKKAEDVESGEIRPHGKPFERKVEDVDKKVPEARGATAGESPRQAGGRAFRDPFDSVQRTEIVPTDPALARPEASVPRAGAPGPADAERHAGVGKKRGDGPEPRIPAGAEATGGEVAKLMPPAGAGAMKRAGDLSPTDTERHVASDAKGAGSPEQRLAAGGADANGGEVSRPALAAPPGPSEMKRADLAPPLPSAAGEGKRAEPTGPSPAASGEAVRAERVELPREAGPGEARRKEQVVPLPAGSAETKRAEVSETTPAATGEAKASAAAADKAAAASRAAAADRADAERLETAIRQALTEALPGILPHIDVTVTPEGVLVSLTDDFDFGMFAIGSAEPRPATHVVMEKVGKILQARTETLIVRGHTDSRKYRTAAYDNWRLSAARAHAAYTMLVRGGVDETRFERIEGHADRSPRVALDTEAAQNRRIEILLRKPQP
jgi:chemotaxis protein MotB